jgi:hypothetical protein
MKRCRVNEEQKAGRQTCVASHVCFLCQSIQKQIVCFPPHRSHCGSGRSLNYAEAAGRF